MGEAADYWEAVQAQLFPGDKSLYSKLRAVGVMSYSVALVGCKAHKYADGSGQVVTGTIRLNHTFPTAL